MNNSFIHRYGADEWVAVADEDAMDIPEIAKSLMDNGLHADWDTNDKYMEDVPLDLPKTWQICDTCRGEGRHSLRFGAITAGDRARDWDHDDFDNYMNGAYDVGCDYCNGTGKVREIAEELLSDKCKKLLDDWWDQEIVHRAEMDAERRMGC